MGSLEEITEEEFNRTGKLLEKYYNDLSDYYNSVDKEKQKEIYKEMLQYEEMIYLFNDLVKEINLYSPDHIIKYYYDKDKGEVTYKKQKKQKIGF